jgi:hypothetical protein
MGNSKMIAERHYERVVADDRSIATWGSIVMTGSESAANSDAARCRSEAHDAEIIDHEH